MRTQQALKEEIEGCKRQVQEECEAFLEKWRKSESTYHENMEELQRQITIARNDKFAAEDLVKQQQIDINALDRIIENLKFELAGEVRKRNAKYFRSISQYVSIREVGLQVDLMIEHHGLHTERAEEAKQKGSAESGNVEEERRRRKTKEHRKEVKQRIKNQNLKQQKG